MIDPRIFRAYDIRGKAHSQLSAEACELIGRGFGSALVEKYGTEHPTVILGNDARLSSPEFERAALKGLMDAGCIVKRIAQTPSPLSYYAVCEQHADGGLQITASHNPKDDNGIKLCIRGAEAYSGADLQRLRERIEEKDFCSGKGSEQMLNATSPYVRKLTEMFANKGKGMKVVIDTGNGVAGPVYAEILRYIGCEVVELFTVPDGNFPNHPADPSKHTTLRDLQATVKKEKANIGLAFDGDGDRLGLVDENGAIVTADQTLLLLAKDHLSRHKGMPVIFTVSNSSVLETEVKKWGGKPVMCKVGHSFVEHAMRDQKALLGGEQSGHFFLGEDYFAFDDALVAALRVIAIVGQKKLSQLISVFPTVYQMPELRPACPDEKKASVVEHATKHFTAKYPVNTLDGARIDFGDGAWAGIRYSNTSPCLSICIEARSEKKLKEVEQEVLEHLGTYKEVEL